ncbi:hypothetical protein D3C84_384910 [compost metagenome]
MHVSGHLNAFGITAGKQNGQGRTQCACFCGQFATVHNGQPDIRHHQVDVLARILERFQRLFAAIGLKHLELQFLQHIDNQHAHDGIVFDNKDDMHIGVGHSGHS